MKSVYLTNFEGIYAKSSHVNAQKMGDFGGLLANMYSTIDWESFN